MAKKSHAHENPHFPILLLTAEKGYDNYAGEILRAEGFNEFLTSTLTARTTLDDLKSFNLVMLTEATLTKPQAKLLERFVNEGGSLLAFRPDRKLAPVFGLQYFLGTAEASYIVVDTSTIAGKGIVSQPLQVHGKLDTYTLNAGRRIASLCKDAIAASEFPAVVVNHYGKGKAVAFLYNLPMSILSTRQGKLSVRRQGDRRHNGDPRDGHVHQRLGGHQQKCP